MKSLTLKLKQVDSIYHYVIKDPGDIRRFRIKAVGVSESLDEILEFVRGHFEKKQTGEGEASEG